MSIEKFRELLSYAGLSPLQAFLLSQSLVLESYAQIAGRVAVISGPFEGCFGKIEAVDICNDKVTVMVEMFDSAHLIHFKGAELKFLKAGEVEEMP